MSSFLVVWNRDGEPIAASIAAIADAHRGASAALAPRRLDRSDVAAWHWPGTWAPGAEEALPLERGGWTGSGVLRLDARPTLAGAVRDATGPGPEDDASLAWRAFAAWGEHAPDRWLGDYAVAAVAADRGRLVVACGITGVRGCFHLSHGALECVSDDPGLLVRLRGGRRDLSPQAVAEYLRHGQLVAPTRTFHRDVHRVPAAHTLVVSRDGARRLRRHWEIPRPEERVGVPADQLCEEFRAVLACAVADRLRGPRAALLLSGGLDSAALALTARRAAPAVALDAMTVSWERMIADPEADFARAVAAAGGFAHAVIARAPDEGLVADAAFWTPEPVPAVEPVLWRIQAAQLATRGPVVLNGEGADAVLRPTPLLSQLRHGGFRRTASDWLAYARDVGGRPWIGLRSGRLPFAAARRVQAPAIPRWLRPDAAALASVETLPVATTHPRPEAVRALSSPTWDAACWLDDPVISGVSVVVLLPFMDPRVLAFCLSVPVVPWAQRKHLLRRAFRAELPAAVAAREKSPLRGYDAARVRAWRAIGAPAPLPAAVDEWVDLDAWRRTLADPDDARSVMDAWRVLELSRWLAQPMQAP